MQDPEQLPAPDAAADPATEVTPTDPSSEHSADPATKNTPPAATE